MKPLKPTLSIAELQKTIGLWKSRKITDSVIPKLLNLYLGLTPYMNEGKAYPVENFYEISIALAFKNAKFLTEAVKRCGSFGIYNPQIQISAESETKRSIFREKDKTKRSKKESAQHSKSRNKSFVMTSVSAL